MHKPHRPMFFPLMAEAWVSINASRMRAFLAMLGVIIGVASVILMVAIGTGSQRRIEKAINSLGNNLLILSPTIPAPPKGLRRNSKYMQFTIKDANAIAQLPSVEMLAYTNQLGRQPIASDAIADKSEILGSVPDFFPVRNWVIAEGDSFNDTDLAASKRVAVIGNSIANKYFPDQQALGQILYIGEKRLPFVIIGILKSKGINLGGGDQDELVVIPITTMIKTLLGPYDTQVKQILIKTHSADLLDVAYDEAQTLLRQMRNIPDTLSDNFMIENLNNITQVAADATRSFSLLLGSIASISLVVGSIGIMNIMLVTVSERTREIGIRKAIGATERQILIQFLLEAIMISALGSGIGFLISIGLGYLVESLFSVPVAYSMWSVVMALLMASVIGIVSGLYPARKAAKMQPIEALRTVGS